MSFSKRALSLYGIMFLWASTVSCAGTPLEPGKSGYITINLANLSEGERIVGFEIHIHGARISSIQKLPIGWQVSIKNGSDWEAEAKGGIEVGSAAQPTAFLTKILSCERSGIADLGFGVDGVISVSRDMEHVRQISIVPSLVSIDHKEVIR